MWNDTACPPSPNSINFLLVSPQKNTTMVCVPEYYLHTLGEAGGTLWVRHCNAIQHLMLWQLWSQLWRHGILMSHYKAKIRCAKQHFCPYYAARQTVFKGYKKTLTSNYCSGFYSTPDRPTHRNILARHRLHLGNDHSTSPYQVKVCHYSSRISWCIMHSFTHSVFNLQNT